MAAYNTYDFDSDTPFKPLKCGCEHGGCTVDINIDMDDFKNTVETVVKDNIDELGEKLDEKLKDISELDEKLKSISEIEEKLKGIEELNDKLNGIHHQVKCSTNNIINEIKEGNKEICLCNMANKNDIKQAVEQINTHIDAKFDEVDFIKQFDDLNNQLKELKIYD